MQGFYFYGDYCSGEIFAGTLASGVWSSASLPVAAANLTTFGEDSSGELYAGTEDGRLFRIVSSAAATPTPTLTATSVPRVTPAPPLRSRPTPRVVTLAEVRKADLMERLGGPPAKVQTLICDRQVRAGDFLVTTPLSPLARFERDALSAPPLCGIDAWCRPAKAMPRACWQHPAGRWPRPGT